MKRVIQFLAVILSLASGYEFKHVSAQAQSTTPLEVADANMLPTMRPTFATVRAKRVYGADLQFEYYWKAGTPMGARTSEFVFKRYIIMGTTSQGGYWTTPKTFIDADNVLNMDSLLKTKGFLSGTGWNARIVADSSRLVTEVGRATSAENLKTNLTYTNSLQNRIVADSNKLVTETSRATLAEGNKEDRLTFAYGLTRAANNIALDTSSATGVVSKGRLNAMMSASPANLTFTTPLVKSGTAVSVNQASISQSGVISASEYTNFNSSFTRRTRYFTPTGESTAVTKIWTGRIAVTASGAVVDYSNAGFSSVSNIQVTTEANTTLVPSIPLASIRNFTNTSAIINLLLSGSTTVVVGGLVNGLTAATGLTGTFVHVTVTGN